MQPLPTIDEVLQSPYTHEWLKTALQSALSKDCVDVMYDAQLLAALLKARCDKALGRAA